MTTFEHATSQLVASYWAEPNTSARVLLTTIFGDSLLPRSQAIGVQTLADLVRPLGINERLVRTSLRRLAEETLVVGDREGRQSYYQVAPQALTMFLQADKRIYHLHPIEWDRQWTIAMVDQAGTNGEERGALLQELSWLGLRPLGPGVFVSPTVPLADVEAASTHAGVELSLLTRAPVPVGALASGSLLRGMVDPDGRVEERFRLHLSTFRPLIDIAAAASPVDAFVVRTMLIDSWRRIVLNTPELPTELLPPEWSSDEAFDMTAELYRRLLPPSELHLDGLMGNGRDDTGRILAERFDSTVTPTA